MARLTTKLWSVLLVSAALVFTACGDCGKKKSPKGTASKSDPSSAASGAPAETLPSGLVVRVSSGKPGAYAVDRIPPARSTKLADSESSQLLARVPVLPESAADKLDFALPEATQPPPIAGETVSNTFPPDPSTLAPPAVSDTGKSLEVLRYAPVGEVAKVPRLSVTFSQPMVAVTSHQDTVAKGVPVELTPQPKGAWRWVGTKTLLFDADPDFPKATEYVVKIPAGTKSATGGVLAEAKRWTFETPPAQLVSGTPVEDGQPLEPVLLATFDQDVDALAVLAHVEIKAGGQTFGARKATPAEIQADEAVAKQLEAGRETPKRHVAFRADRPLPYDAEVQVTIGEGTPSAEGPRLTTSVQRFSFRTHGPLKVVSQGCGYGGTCRPNGTWYIRMSNKLDAEAFDADSLQVEPALEGMHAQVDEDRILIQGASKGRTSYQVTLPASIRDTFEQTLAKPATSKFNVGPANPSLWGREGFTVLDPSAAKPTYNVFSINYERLAVRLYAVKPSDWSAFAEYRRRYYISRGPVRIPGRKVLDTIIETTGDADERTETRIDLSPALKNGFGHVIAIVTAADVPKGKRAPVLEAWVQVTHIGLDAFVDGTDLLGWANSLDDGRPLAGVKLAIVPAGATGTTDAEGLATLRLGKAGPWKRYVLTATLGEDIAILPDQEDYLGAGSSWHRNDKETSLSWIVFDDRGMYRPGEEVHVKGWVRRVGERKGGDVEALGVTGPISYTVRDHHYRSVAKGTVQLNELGGFHASFRLPEDMTLGTAILDLRAKLPGLRWGKASRHRFEVQEFRRPEFEVSVTTDKGTHTVGGHSEVTVAASYYSGGGLPGAEVRWAITSKEGHFTPPNREDFSFGTWTPWWQRRSDEHKRGEAVSLDATTDGTGRHVLRMDFVSVEHPRPMSVKAEATVTDVNRQAWVASANLLVHPSALYIGLRSKRVFLERGRPLEIESLVVDHDGKAVPGRAITLRAVREEWVREKGDWKTEERDPQYCKPTSAAEPSACSFETKVGGTYKVTASVVDDDDRRNESEITVWVSGGTLRPHRKVEMESVQLIPDKKEYQPGDTAEILVQAPFQPSHGMLTVRRLGILHTERFEMDTTSKTLTVKILDEHIPNLYVHVDLVGAATRLDDSGNPAPDLPRRPAFASGSLSLSVPPLSRTLAVEVTPEDEELVPGGKTALDLRVRDATDQPVSGAEIAVLVVDEAVLALSEYKTPDPIRDIYGSRDEGVEDFHNRSMVALAAPKKDSFDEDVGAGGTGTKMALEEGKMGKKDSDREAGRYALEAPEARGPSRPKDAAGPIVVRKSFDALAVFAPEVRTDENGAARVEVQLPDSLTRYRVMAVAVDEGKLFGKGESAITARQPLMVRPSPPRFLNFGDRFELPIVLQNQTAEPMKVRVAVRAYNATLSDGIGKRIEVPANDRVEVRFPAAAERPGTARFQIAADAGDWADAVEVALPVWTPATTEAFATYGEIDEGAVKQPVALPGGVVEQFGGLEISTSSTQLQALTDAFLYLVAYPYECSEQMSSRVLAVAALRDVLTAFKAEGLPPAAEIEAAVARDLKRLAALQNSDGGFAFWRRGDRSWPYLGVHVAHSLARAKSKGYSVDKQMWDRSLYYLREIERRFPHYYSLELRRTLIAYALYVRKLMGDTDAARARKLISEAGLEHLSMEAVGWLLAVLAGDRGSKDERAAIHRYLANRVNETASAANFTTSYGDGAHLILASDRRVDGIILEALILDAPKSDLIPKLVRGLLDHRKRGRWGNTQDNAFVLLALDKYFEVFEKIRPDFVARAWLGNEFAGEHAFRGRTTERQLIDIPMRYVVAAKAADLILAKDGGGRLYYRIGMTYAPADLALDPADHGFTVERRYEAIDDPSDVRRDKDGTWHFRAGARVRVRLEMVAQDRRYHVALVDPLPAGLEPMNPALAVTGAIPEDPEEQESDDRYWWWHRTWYQHQNLRDERVEAFTSQLWAGVHEYTYVTRATTPGHFVVPPTKAEEMYHPETFGRAASDRVIVE